MSLDWIVLYAWANNAESCIGAQCLTEIPLHLGLEEGARNKRDEAEDQKSRSCSFGIFIWWLVNHVFSMIWCYFLTD